MCCMKKALYRLETYYKQKATASERDVLVYLLNQTREATAIDIHTLAKNAIVHRLRLSVSAKRMASRALKN